MSAGELALRSSRFRIMKVDSDNMEPTLRPRLDYVLVAPIEHYTYEGIYVFDADPFPGMVLKRVHRERGGVWLYHDNKLYDGEKVPHEWFASHVLGKVAAVITCHDHYLLEGLDPPGLARVA